MKRWEQGFTAAAAVYTPQLHEAAKEIAWLKAEVKRLNNIITLHDQVTMMKAQKDMSEKRC